uniref:Family with sequence similarity 98 member C n=1 Tax=Eptatretus burgeri TaxID=7764 RepID=A0A8C4R261_EPTBU
MRFKRSRFYEHFDTKISQIGRLQPVIWPLEDCGATGGAGDEEALEKFVTGGAESPKFTGHCARMVAELRMLSSLEESLTATSAEEAETFQLEVSGLLAEMHCPYETLTSGDVAERLTSRDARIKLLCTYASVLFCSSGLPPSFIDCIYKYLHLPQVPTDCLGKPLLKETLSNEQWRKLEVLNENLLSEYELRRSMLLKRLDVTMQSFGWSELAKVNVDAIAEAYLPLRRNLSDRSRVSLAHLLAAREDLSRIVKASGSNVQRGTGSRIHKVMHVLSALIVAAISHIPPNEGMLILILYRGKKIVIFHLKKVNFVGRQMHLLSICEIVTCRSPERAAVCLPEYAMTVTRKNIPCLLPCEV